MKKNLHKIIYTVITLFLIIPSLLMFSSFAKYKRVIIPHRQFSVSGFQFQSLDDTNYTATIPLDKVYPGSTKGYSLKVKNFVGSVYSNVPLTYTVTVSSNGSLPLTVTLSGSGTGAGTSKSYNSGSATKSLTYTGSFTKGSSITHSLTLTVAWPSSSGGFDPNYINTSDILTININSLQQVIS